MVDVVKWTGVMKVRELPKGWTLDDFKYWWLPRLEDPKTGIVRIPSRMSEEEKDNLTIAEASNMLLVNGVNNILSYVIAGGAGPGVMFQYLALGNGALAGVL